MPVFPPAISRHWRCRTGRLREYAARRGWTIALQVREVNSGAAHWEAREKVMARITWPLRRNSIHQVAALHWYHLHVSSFVDTAAESAGSLQAEVSLRRNRNQIDNQ